MSELTGSKCICYLPWVSRCSSALHRWKTAACASFKLGHREDQLFADASADLST